MFARRSTIDPKATEDNSSHTDTNGNESGPSLVNRTRDVEPAGERPTNVIRWVSSISGLSNDGNEQGDHLPHSQQLIEWKQVSSKSNDGPGLIQDEISAAAVGLPNADENQDRSGLSLANLSPPQKNTTIDRETVSEENYQKPGTEDPTVQGKWANPEMIDESAASDAHSSLDFKVSEVDEPQGNQNQGEGAAEHNHRQAKVESNGISTYSCILFVLHLTRTDRL